jgi:hypothetical protein
MNVNLDDVKAALQKQQLPAATVQLVVAELKQAAELKKEERTTEKAHNSKNQFVVVLSDPKNELAGKDFVAWVAQIPEDDAPLTVIDKVNKSAWDYNAGTRAGQKAPIKTISEAFEFVKRKFFKENKVLVKTKEPVQVIITDNKIPTVTNTI